MGSEQTRDLFVNLADTLQVLAIHVQDLEECLVHTFVTGKSGLDFVPKKESVRKKKRGTEITLYLKEDAKESEEKNTNIELEIENTKSKQTAIIHVEELEKKLANAIQNEDYELAAKIRDKIKRRND